jgi:hypothetical protein
LSASRRAAGADVPNKPGSNGPPRLCLLAALARKGFGMTHAE